MSTLSHPLAAVSCALLLLLAGCASPGADQDGAAIASATVAPGTQAHLPLIADGVTDGAGEVEVAVVDDGGLTVEAPTSLQANESGTVAGWVAFTVPAETTQGPHSVELELRPADGEARTVQFDLEVETPTETLSSGDVAVVELVARTTDGALVTTNVARIANASLPKADTYQAPQAFQPLPLQLSPRSQLPPGLVSALANASVNQSLTVEVPQAFGPATVEREQAREQTIQRVREEQRSLEAPRQMAAQQGLIGPQTQVGDRVQLGGPIPYKVSHLNETQVRLELDVEQGQNVTLYQAWPNASQVTEVTNDTVVLETDPPVAEGESFTWRPAWTNATEIVSMDNGTITIRHSPEEGTTFTERTQQGQAIQSTVVALRDETIVTEQQNPHPLAGQTILFDLTVLEERQPPRQPTMGQPGGR